MVDATYAPNGGPAAAILASGWEGVQRAVVFFHAKLQEALSVPNTGQQKGGRTVYPSPSQPGEPPRLRTGWLRQNVMYELDAAGRVARVGVTTNARYGIFLETGTGRMAARPWLLATLRANLARIEALSTGGR